MSAPSASLLGLSWVYQEFEDRLTEASHLGLKLIDRVDPLNANPEHIAHKGIAVDIPSTDNTGDYRDIDNALVADTVMVSTTYRVRPHEQRTSRREAIDLEEQIRAWLLDSAWQRDLHPSYVRTTFRGPHPKSAEFFLITQQFTTRREAALGG